MVKAKSKLPMARAIDVANEALRVANKALAQFESHERECVKQRQAIADALAQTNLDRKEMHKENKASVGRIYALLWKAAAGIIFLLLGFLWQLLTKS
jgi:hypothetical protein